jgi:hypothetical protein
MLIEDTCFLSPYAMIRLELPQRIPCKGIGLFKVNDGLGVIDRVKLSLHGRKKPGLMNERRG